jgi:hypothetical protein
LAKHLSCNRACHDVRKLCTATVKSLARDAIDPKVKFERGRCQSKQTFDTWNSLAMVLGEVLSHGDVRRQSPTCHSVTPPPSDIGAVPGT